MKTSIVCAHAEPRSFNGAFKGKRSLLSVTTGDVVLQVDIRLFDAPPQLLGEPIVD